MTEATEMKNQLMDLSFEQRCRYIAKERCNSGKWELGDQIKPYLRSCSNEEKMIELCFPVQSWQLNPRKELHGGMLACFFDTALGITAHCASAQWQTTTTDMAVSYLRKIVEGDTVCIRCRVVKGGRRMIFVQGEAYILETNKLAGTGHASFMVLEGVCLESCV